MEKTTTEITVDYIKEHPYVKVCLKKGLLNYSSLARLIAKELHIEKQSSKAAILIASRRFREKITKDISSEREIKDLFSTSELDIKNKIVVFILGKHLNFDRLLDIGKSVKKDEGLFYFLEGSHSCTIITQQQHSPLFERAFKNDIIKKTENLALVLFRSPPTIEHTIGAVAYLSSLFAENGINIIELFSSWTDTAFVIDSRDLTHVFGFLKY